MSETHIATRDGQKAVYQLADLTAGLAAGRIPENALYWRAGMSEWRPVTELGGRRAAASAPPLPGYRFLKDPTKLTTILIFLVYTRAVASLISIFSDFAQLALLGSQLTEAAGAANDARQQIVAIIYLLVFVVTGILFLIWINRANKNCHGFTSGMEFTSGWSIGWYFIPFANLIKPFQAMSEIWRVSHDPVNWKSMKPSALMRWWWGLWLLSGFLGQMSWKLSLKADSVSKLQDSTTISIASSAVDIVLCIVAAVMVGKIFKAQARLVTRS